MFLTQAFLNPRRRGAYRLLTDPQAMHAAVLAAFAWQPVPEPVADAPRVLWRLDVDNPYRPELWLVSPRRPDLTHLAEQAGWPAADEADEPQWQSRPYRPVLDRLVKGDTYAFRLIANPTRSVRAQDGSSRTKRVEHVTAEHQVRWLAERSESLGVRLLSSSAVPLLDGVPALDLRLFRREKLSFRRREPGGRPVTIVRVGYEGGLEVTDPEAFRRALTSGVGRARAYGCGLLTIAPLPPRR